MFTSSGDVLRRWAGSGTVGTNIPTQATNVLLSIENPPVHCFIPEVENTKIRLVLGAWTGDVPTVKMTSGVMPNESSTYLNPSDGHKSIYDPCPKGIG